MPPASGEKRIPPHGLLGIKRPWRVCFLAHHGQCLFHLLVDTSQDDRETQLIKHGHEALGKITASMKRTHANVERPVALPWTWSLCARNDTVTRVLRYFFFFGFHRLEVVLPAACWSEFFLSQSQATGFKAFLLILRSGHSS